MRKKGDSMSKDSTEIWIGFSYQIYKDADSEADAINVPKA